MSDLRAALTFAIHDELDAALSRIAHCLGQLSDEQVWWRERPDRNAIGNLVLHLTGNVTQLIVCGVGGTPDHRERQAEFDARGSMPTAELIAKLTAAVGEAKKAFVAASEEDLLNRISVKQYDWTGMQAVIRSVAHFRGHTQEIIHQTRTILGEAYQFAGMK